ARVLSVFSDGAEPRFNDVRILDGTLKSVRPDLYDKLQDCVRRASALVKRVIDDLTAYAPLLTEPPVATVLSSESSLMGDAAPRLPPDQIASTRYLCLLECLFDRTLALLCRLPGTHLVLLQVLGRDVWDVERGR